jgi:hypothetical protein
MHKVVLILFGFLAVGSCAAMYKLYGMFYNVILEQKDVQNFKVKESPEAERVRLNISGHPFYSGMAVRTITEKKDGPTITISVHLAVIGLMKSKRTGIFEYELIVPESVDEVRFGRTSTLIWKRQPLSRANPDLTGDNQQVRRKWRCDLDHPAQRNLKPGHDNDDLRQHL